MPVLDYHTTEKAQPQQQSGDIPDLAATPLQVPIIIGVTGHRDLREATEFGDQREIRETVRTILSSIMAQYPETPIHCLSPLAEGADQLVAWVALELFAARRDQGLPDRLVVPLPMPAGEYLATFNDATSSAQFHSLIAQAVPFVVPLAAGNSPSNPAYHEQQYAEAGCYVVENSHILLALWDGSPAESPCGAAAMVAYRLGGQRPFSHAVRPPLDEVDFGPVYHIITPRQKHATAPERALATDILFPRHYRRDASGVLPDARECNATWTAQKEDLLAEEAYPDPRRFGRGCLDGLRHIEHVFKHHLFGQAALQEQQDEYDNHEEQHEEVYSYSPPHIRLPYLTTDRAHAPIHEDLRAWEQRTDLFLQNINSFNQDLAMQGFTAVHLRAALDQFGLEEKLAGSFHAHLLLRRFLAADWLANHYSALSKRFFKGMLWAVIFSGVIFELVAHVLRPEPAKQGWLMLFYPITLLIAFGVFSISMRKSLQRKHMDYRALAEGMRVQLFWYIGGVRESVATHYLRHQHSVLEWIRAAIQGWNLPMHGAGIDAFDSAYDSPESIAITREHWLHNQARYYARNKRRRKEWVFLYEMGAYAAMCFSLLFGFLTAWSQLSEGKIPFIERCQEELPVLLTGLPPVIAAALLTYAEKMAFTAEAKEFQRMKDLFALAENKFIYAALEPKIDVKRLLHDLGSEALAEHGNWVLLHRERPYDVPVK